jgi:hypothetical protein
MNFVHYLDENGFYSTIRYQGSTFAEWIDNINEPHRLLRGKFPKGSLPEFWTQPDDTDPTGKSILVHFYSKRGKLYAPFSKGIIIEAARVYFSLDIILIPLEEKMEENCFHAIWRIPAPRPISPKRRTVSFEEISNKIDLEKPSPRLMFNFSRHDTVAETVTTTTTATTQDQPKCPFGHATSMTNTTKALTSLNNNIDINSLGEMISDESTPKDIKPIEENIGINAKVFQQIFPFHIVINPQMNIVQMGPKMKEFFQKYIADEMNSNSLMNHYFQMILPLHYPLTWQELKKLQNNSIELALHGYDRDIKFRGEIVVLEEDILEGKGYLAFLISPDVLNVNEFVALDLRLSDIPKYSFQRDILLAEEHMKIETDKSVLLTKLSKRVSKESKKSKVSNQFLIISSN